MAHDQLLGVPEAEGTEEWEAFVIEQRGIDYVPEHDRRAKPIDLLWMWSGTTSNVLVFFYGAIVIAIGVSFLQAALIIILGTFAGYLLLGISSLIGPNAGTSALITARAPFGINFNRFNAFSNWALVVCYEVADLVVIVLAFVALAGKMGISDTTATKVVVILIAVAIQLPLPLFGPTLCELEVVGGSVELIRTLPLLAAGRPISGRAPPGAVEAAMEPTYGVDGVVLAPDPDGADTEGVAALADGTFSVADEYGPSILNVEPGGEVTERWWPKGRPTPHATIPARNILPHSAKHRRLNRGFEGIAVTPDGQTLYVALQSALTGDDNQNSRIWALDARTGERQIEFIYPFERPKRFLRDARAGKVSGRDLKICDLAWAGPGRLLVLERISRSTKIFSVALRGETLEKRLVLDTDETPQIAPDLEGMVLTSDREVILVNDNDFGTEGARTAFFRVTFDHPV